MTTRATFAEHDREPVHGLPAELPAGERVLWQGAPGWRSLALHAYRVRELTAYFALIVAARAGYLLSTGSDVESALRGCMGPALLSIVCLALLGGIAALAARSTVYTITTKRVVIRQGIALASSINLPFAALDAAQLRLRSSGTGDLALCLNREQRVSYLWMWPHVRPWHITHPQPSLRSLTDAQHVAGILHHAFIAATPNVESTSTQQPRIVPEAGHAGAQPLGVSA